MTASEMVSAELVGTLDAVRVTDWLDGVGISRSTAYELFKLLGIEPEARRVPGIRRPASHLNAEQMDALAPWVAEIKRGATLPAIRKTLGQNGNVLDASLGQNASVLDDQYGQNDNVLDSQSKLVAGALNALQKSFQPRSRSTPLQCQPHRVIHCDGQKH